MTTTHTGPADIRVARAADPRRWDDADLVAYRRRVAAWWRLDDVPEHPLRDVRNAPRAVVAVDGPYADAATRYAALTGAEHRTADVAALASGTALPPTGSVVVVATPDQLSFDLVEIVAEHAARRRDLVVGYLTAPGLASFDLVLRKAVRTMHGGTGRSARGYVDEFRHDHGRVLPGAPVEPGLRSAAVLAGDYRTLLVGGHGDGLHVRLPDAMICGVVGLAETSGGRAVAGGCRRADRPVCKKVTAPGLPVFPAGDLRAELLVVLSCKSFVTTELVYPSNLSMALSAVEGHPGAVVGVTRQIVFDDAAVDAVDALLQAGTPVGRLVAMLNEQQLRRGNVPCYAVLGDPDATFAVPDATPMRLRAAGSVAWPDGGPVAVRAPRGGTYLVHGRDRTHVFTATVVNEPPRDASRELAETVTALTDVRRRLADGEALERMAGIFADHLGLRDDAEFRALADRVSAARSAVADAVMLAAGIFVPDTRLCATWHPALDLGDVRRLLGAWNDALADLVAGWFIHEEFHGRYVADHFIPSLYGFRSAGPAYVLPDACPACGGRLVANDYDGALLGLGTRTLVMCAACGPAAISGALRADMRITGDARPGGRVRVTMTVDHPVPAHGTGVVAVLQVKPRSKVNPPRTERRSLPPGATSVAFDLDLPADAACDVWSSRGAVVSDAEVAFARRTFSPIAVE